MPLKRRSGIRSSALASLPTAGPGIRVQSLPGGRAIVSADARSGKRARTVAGALTLTKTAPVGYDPEGAPSGVPIWVTWGTAGAVIPSLGTFTTPIGYVTSTGTRYVWAKIGLSNTAITVATSLDFVTDTSSTAYPTPDMEADGALPDYLYVPLGRFTATGTAPNLVVNVFNGGSGSIVVAAYIARILVSDTGAPTSFTRALSWWRTDAA